VLLEFDVDVGGHGGGMAQGRDSADRLTGRLAHPRRIGARDRGRPDLSRKEVGVHAV